MSLIKKLLCNHPNISTKTETKLPIDNHLLIVKSIIQCDNCGKTFAQHPRAICCHVQHIHSEIVREQFMQYYNSFKQQEEIKSG